MLATTIENSNLKSGRMTYIYKLYNIIYTGERDESSYDEP